MLHQYIFIEIMIDIKKQKKGGEQRLVVDQIPHKNIKKIHFSCQSTSLLFRILGIYNFGKQLIQSNQETKEKKLTTTIVGCWSKIISRKFNSRFRAQVYCLEYKISIALGNSWSNPIRKQKKRGGQQRRLVVDQSPHKNIKTLPVCVGWLDFLSSACTSSCINGW